MRLAVEHVRRMRGGAQAHLMRCDDDGYYIVKFQNNPQHLRILANEMLGTLRAASGSGRSAAGIDRLYDGSRECNWAWDGFPVPRASSLVRSSPGTRRV